VTWLLSLPGRLKGALVGALAGILALAGVYIAGRRDGRQRGAQKAAEDYRKTRQRIDDAEKPSDPDAARAWLADRMRDRKR
jgi:hypothetical protein